MEVGFVVGPAAVVFTLIGIVAIIVWLFYRELHMMNRYLSRIADAAEADYLSDDEEKQLAELAALRAEQKAKTE